MRRHSTGFAESVFWDISCLCQHTLQGAGGSAAILARRSGRNKTLVAEDEICGCMPQGKVLIVDDESSLRRILRMSLTARGFEVAEASTGEQALALLDADHYDLVLLDINMPGRGGIETCREIQRLSSRPAVLI